MNKNKILYNITFYVIASVLIVAGFISFTITNYLKNGIDDSTNVPINQNEDNQKSIKPKTNEKIQKHYEDIMVNFEVDDVKTSDTNKEIDEYIKELGEFIMTAYTSDCKGCIGITKTGYDVRNTIYYEDGSRIVAVDPNVIGLHSRLRITMPNGEVIEAIALDTGGAIKGRRLDLLVENREKARVEVGRKRVKVELIK